MWLPTTSDLIIIYFQTTIRVKDFTQIISITRWRNLFKLINMRKKLHMLLVFSNLLMFKTLSSDHRMYNLYTKFVKILEICKQFSENLVNELGNVLLT